MLDRNEIQKKYDEFYKEFSDKHIDDFETFLRARVIEHCINTFNEPSDRASELVLSSLENYVYIEKTIDEPATHECNINDLQMEKTMHVSQEKSTDIMKTIAVTSLVVLAGYAIHRLCKKR